MTSIPITDILTIIFVLVDDWYRAEGHKYLQGKVGRKPEFKDSEVMTLMLAQDFIPYPSETPSCWIRVSSTAEREGCAC
jgi:hypothetical protein